MSREPLTANLAALEGRPVRHRDLLAAALVGEHLRDGEEAIVGQLTVRRDGHTISFHDADSSGGISGGE